MLTQKQMIAVALRDAGFREVPRDVHDVLCNSRNAALLQEVGAYQGLMYCTLCGLGYRPNPLAVTAIPARTRVQ